MDIDLDNVPHDLEGLRTYIINFQRDFDAHNHDGNNSRSFLTLLAETMSARVMQIRKTSFTDTASGMWMGLVGNTMKFILGNSTNSISWDGSTLTITGTISGSTITGGSLTIGNNATIDSNGNATFVGLTSLSIKAYTCFETAARYSSSSGGTGSQTFDSSGLTVATGATGTSFQKTQWFVTQSVFAGSPTFSCVLNMANLTAASGSGGAFFGLGEPVITGSGVFSGSDSFCGFYIQKAAGVVTLYAAQNDTTAITQSSALTTLATNDVVDLILKMNGTGSVDYYWRKNVGTLSAKTNLATRTPTAASNKITFGTSNTASAFEYSFIVISSSYER